ncbi:acylphosphatase [Rhodospirillaceae bacterium KN72]|uniref:Acylphosphatase n=1 Tax=Pacificispira spongiicola TaxID=2729598 RepID=A0A7Y0E581_9PROT|nr:acylphosphatase [Pacificispira spongiicola]NMM46621.1 acylphosphatase [Pacificispira spongiicola]
MKSVKARIEGKVQGVWFRAWTEKTAVGLGLDGWVRNRPDGSVEAVFSGPTETVERMLADCWNGPPLSRVTAVQTDPAETPDQAGFIIRPDG